MSLCPDTWSSLVNRGYLELHAPVVEPSAYMAYSAAVGFAKKEIRVYSFQHKICPFVITS